MMTSLTYSSLSTTSSLVIIIIIIIKYYHSGASTPYKRWSKCTMEKVGRSIFAET